jgi:hypothetical protein
VRNDSSLDRAYHPSALRKDTYRIAPVVGVRITSGAMWRRKLSSWWDADGDVPLEVPITSGWIAKDLVQDKDVSKWSWAHVKLSAQEEALDKVTEKLHGEGVMGVPKEAQALKDEFNAMVTVRSS